MRVDRHWQLIGSDPFDNKYNGLGMAFLAWAQRRELYATKVGFRGALRLLKRPTSGRAALWVDRTFSKIRI
jgi:hypothetical protein